MKTEGHISLAHLHLLLPITLLFFFPPVWKLRLYFVRPDWPAILLIFLIFFGEVGGGSASRKTQFSLVSQAWPLENSFLFCWPGPVR